MYNVLRASMYSSVFKMYMYKVHRYIQVYSKCTEDINIWICTTYNGHRYIQNGHQYISKWTSNLNKVLNKNPGHSQYFLNLKHAAYSNTKKILFVNRGVDITRPLSAQNDCFWWGFQNFSLIDKPYKTFSRIVRGYESEHLNQHEISKNNVVCTLFKQPLSNKNVLCGIFKENGEILDLFENK